MNSHDWNRIHRQDCHIGGGSSRAVAARIGRAELQMGAQRSSDACLHGESTYKGEHDAWGSAVQARKQASWCLLGDGFGHAYGSPNWNFPKNWREVIELPGAKSLNHFRRLFESRPWWKLRPATNNIVAVEGRGSFATNDSTIDLGKLSGQKNTASWFDPRSGKSAVIGNFTDKKRHKFDPPSDGDWVLVLEAAERNYKPTGTKP